MTDSNAGKKKGAPAASPWHPCRTRPLPATGKTEALKVIPDAWLLFEQRQDGLLTHAFPLLLEIDRGTEYQQKFKHHVRARLEFIKQGGGYSQLFATGAVTIAYATTGQTPE